jgi:hypothetical protein
MNDLPQLSDVLSEAHVAIQVALTELEAGNRELALEAFMVASDQVLAGQLLERRARSDLRRLFRDLEEVRAGLEGRPA